MRPARLAEMVAGVLRDRILSGELPDGGWLPKQEDLLAEFGISMPPIREALRILESEGLITVKRGNVGGAVVHLPREAAAASTFGVLLHSRGATLGQLVDAMVAIEPLCVAAAASRGDRATAVPIPRCGFLRFRYGTFSPSSRHRRCTRLLLTFRPARRSAVAARRQPHRGRSRENARSHARSSTSSSPGTGGSSRSVERC